jgi:glycosyltransferase involved in cell wall biosynthesis
MERCAAIVPAYRARATIEDLVRRTLAIVPDVVVVDDGSDDGTADAARAAGAEILVHPENRGKGAALATGFHHWLARGVDALVTIDADLQHMPEEIPKLFAAELPAADLVLGVRDHLFHDMSLLRRTGNRLSARLISHAAGVELTDVQTGFRLYRRRLLETVRWRETGYEAESAVLVRAGRMGFSIVSVPVAMGFVDGRATSHFRPFTDSLRIACAVLAARFE